LGHQCAGPFTPWQLGVRCRPDGQPIDLPALDATSVEPIHSRAQKATGGSLLLICEHIDAGHPVRVNNGDVDTVTSKTHGTTLLAVAVDPLTDLATAGQLPLLLPEKALPTQKPSARRDVDQIDGEIPRSAGQQVWVPGSAACPEPFGSGPWPRRRWERTATWRCCGYSAVDGAAPPRAAFAHQAFATWWREHCVDQTVRLHHRSGNGPATCRHSGG
jgi:hypothetical protein